MKAMTPTPAHVARYPVVKARGSHRDLLIREYNATVGETDGNIIAAIITTHTPMNQPGVPSLVQGPLSIPRIRSSVHHHPIPARTKSRDTSPSRARAGAKASARPMPARGCLSAASSKRSGGPGKLSGRKSCLPLVLDAECVDARACRLGDRQVRRDRVEHALEPHGLTRLDAERNDVLDFEVDCVSDAHTVANAVVLDVNRGPLDSEHFPHERGEAGHWAAQLTGEYLHELVGLFLRGVFVDEHSESPVSFRHDLRRVCNRSNLQPADVSAFDLAFANVENERHSAVVVRRAVVERRVAGTDQVTGARLGVTPFEVPRHDCLLRGNARASILGGLAWGVKPQRESVSSLQTFSAGAAGLRPANDTSKFVA